MTYVCDRWPDYIAIMTVGPASCVYGTWATDHGWSLYGLPWGICSYTFYINTIVDFPQGRYEYGNRQTHLGVYPPVLDTTPLYGNAYNILQVSPTQEEWHLICDCDNPPTFFFNRVD